MARKRIKTLASEWGIAVESVLASAASLKLGHAHSESSLLSQEESDRVKSDLDEQAHRESLLRRETVVETSAGRVVEKRLNATVMRRRHAAEPEGAPTAAKPQGAEEPFHFEVEERREDVFAAPFLEEPGAGEPAMPEFLADAGEPGAAPSGRREVGAPAAGAVEPEAAAQEGSQPPASVRRSEPGLSAQSVAAQGASAEARRAGPERPAARDGGRSSPAHGASAPSQPRSAVERAPAASPEGRVVNLTGPGHASAPSLDEGQRGPKVLGKIDLRKTPLRTGPSAGRAGVAQRPAPGTRFAPPVAQQPAPLPSGEGAPASDAGKPGARPLRKKRVVKKGGTDFATEREMRALRVPKKRRALPGKEQKKTEITTPKASKRVIRITEGVTVADLAHTMGVKAAEVIKKLMALGVMATLNQVLDVDTATLVASDFGYSVENVAFDAESALQETTEEPAGETVARAPVVTVMGHVDHGKTSLLDAIRHTKVTAGEFGGITQHIGAYMAEVEGRKITFVDTPGHEAFTAMRARGAKVTDIVVLIVAADEGVMPQTIEAINHARAAKVPIVVAINKIDRAEANVDRVKQQLAEQRLIPEDYGGDTITVPVSARTGAGLDRLLEMILLQADLMELRADPNRPARGTVIESQLDRGRGPVATVLIQEGTLRQGDPFVCGLSFGRVRAMLDHNGQRLSEARPSTPVEIFGLSSVPEPGTVFAAVADEGKARQVAEFRRGKQREGELQKTSRVSLEHLSQRMMAGEVKELRVIIKGDVQGSVEALADALSRLSTDEVKVDLVHSSAGAVSETDVTLAAASRAVIIGFNVRPEPKAAQLAEKEGVDIRLYTVIYEAIDDVREAMEGLLAPTMREKALGRAEVRKTFTVPGGTVAGVMVVDGKVARSARARLVRDGRVAWEGKIASLKRFKEDAREVQAGYECGVGLENFNDVKPGDVIETFEMEAVLRKLGSPRPEPARTGQGVVEKQLTT